MKIVQFDEFAGRLNESFDLLFGEATMPLVLVEAKKSPVIAFPGIKRDPFALLFKSQSPVVLPQQIYRLKNATLGMLDIFLVPVARDVQGIVYQAVYN